MWFDENELNQGLLINVKNNYGIEFQGLSKSTRCMVI